MKRMSFHPSTKRVGDNPNLLHIETELGIINIRVGLSDRRGRKVESIQVLPDDRFSGEPVVRVRSSKRGLRMIQLKTVKA